MAYLVCSQCGGKALAVSTRCPRCQTPFPRVEDRTPPAPKSLRVPILIAAGILVIVTGGYALWRAQNDKGAEPIASPAVSIAPAEPPPDTAGPPVAATTNAPPSDQNSPALVPPPAPARSDSVPWERAIVRSDVNLRTTASRDSESLRILRINQPVELGAFQEGWRQVRVGTLSGWADPRHFEIVPRKR